MRVLKKGKNHVQLCTRNHFYFQQRYDSSLVDIDSLKKVAEITTTIDLQEICIKKQHLDMSSKVGSINSKTHEHTQWGKAPPM